jgi:TolB-like protein/tetratricopeptide (TPR) repeat protein
LLIKRPQELITRDEIRENLWGTDTFVDFDRSLNKAMVKLRHALADDAESPRFIETLPRRGYRFLLPVKSHGADQTNLLQSTNVKVALAVLPFQYLGHDLEHEFLGVALTEELTTQLGGLDPQKLSVTARASVMQFKDSPESAEQIGRSLKVNYLLSGSVQSVGGRLRVSAQLIQVRDECHLWTNTYDCGEIDLLAIQRDIGRAIANEVSLKLSNRQLHRLKDTSPVSPDAQNSYLKGRYYSTQESTAGLNLGIALFEESIRLARGFAPAYAGLAAAYVRLGHWLALPPNQSFPQAKLVALQALDLDDALAEAHTVLADVLFLYEWNWNEAESNYQRALRLNPSSAQTLRSYAGFLLATKRHGESSMLTRRAQSTDPSSIYLSAFSAAQLFCTRQYAESIEAAKRTLATDPGCSTAHLFLGFAYVQIGCFEEALRELKEAVTSVGLKSRQAHVAYALAVCGRVEQAEQLLNELLEESKTSYVSPWLFANIYAGLGLKDKAFECLEECYRQREHDLVFSYVWPQFDSLHSDARWDDLMSRIRLPRFS